eukprot:augustus_masked-scaffold_37-processed-gene-2.21-mRNA-1 protein AED:0.04 eAED:0.04 QI:0/-1/0/1/-1/1/1/0/609
MSEEKRLSNLRRCFSPELVKKIANSKILLIGAGGIGCELLKNLVLCGFQHIFVVDLDSIDISNLNRQFLFSRADVGKAKATSAALAVKKFFQKINKTEIDPFYGNVKEEKFGVEFYKSFDVVLNALDNVSARQHVNRLCMAAGVPLLDSGTTGYLGQVGIMKKGLTKCYDCEIKPVEKKTYPICTIRNTPDKPVHCVVWSKEVVKLLFGNEKDSMLADLSTQDEEDEQKQDSNKEIEILSMIVEKTKKMNIPSNVTTEKKKALLSKYAKDVFDVLFRTEIELKLKMKDGYKGAKFAPKPLETFSPSAKVMLSESYLDEDFLRNKFEKLLKKLYDERYKEIHAGVVEFDKDDDDLMDFVSVLTNLRAMVFGIELKSRFELKGIAGNIIHAIATTNAIVAGIQTMETVKILDNQLKGKPIFSGCKYSWVLRNLSSSGCLLQPQTLEKANSGCYTCGTALVNLTVNVDKFTLRDLVERVLIKRLGLKNPSVMLGTSEIYMSGDDLDDDEKVFFAGNLSKSLRQSPAGGVKHETILSIEDFSQELSFNIIIKHHSDIDNDEGYVLEGEEIKVKRKRAETSNDKEMAPQNKRGKLDDIVLTENGKGNLEPIQLI